MQMAKKQVIAFDTVARFWTYPRSTRVFNLNSAGATCTSSGFRKCSSWLFRSRRPEVTKASDITDAALKVIEHCHQRELSPSQRKKILQGLRELPAFSDVKPGLEAMKSEKNELTVLTNSGRKSAKEALESARWLIYLTGCFPPTT